MPALLLLPPTSLAVEHPDMLAALKSNADSLTSQLDLYVTLREVMAMGSKAPLVEPTRGKTLSSLLSFPCQYADVAKKRGTVEHFLFSKPCVATFPLGFPGKSLLHPVEMRDCSKAGVPPQV